VALTRARKLADWVGDGKELTGTGVPRPAAAVEACQALGIPLPGPRLRSALDVAELMQDWVVALRAGYVISQGARAWAAPESKTSADPQAALDTWLRAAAGELGVPDDLCPGCLIVLHMLHTAGRAVGLEELASAIAAANPEAGAPCPDCGEIHSPEALFDELLGVEDDDEVDDLEHTASTLAVLVAFGAATVSGDTAGLTPLGSVLATAVLEGCAPLPDTDAATLLEVLSTLPPLVAMIMAEPWLAARPPDDAAAELLSFAESVTDTRRVAALALAKKLGPGPMAAWREWASKPGFGAYARAWLAEHGKPVAVHPEDEAWLLTDAFSVILDGMGEAMMPPPPLSMTFEEYGADPTEVLDLVRDSGHPAADEVAAWLSGPPAGPTITIVEYGEATAGQAHVWRGPEWTPAGPAGVYQLKITLRNVTEPPVWRRVLVPADFTLGQLHDVIQLAMGWDFSHLHVFNTRLGDYGTPDPELRFADEYGARLTEVLPRKRSKLSYNYDFGDDWEHDVLVEEKRPAAPGESLPRCVEGEGACPPEDSGGPWGYDRLKEVVADPEDEEHDDMLEWLGLDEPSEFDAAAFTVDEANARLQPRT
jgi:hypothetical protein